MHGPMNVTFANILRNGKF